MVEYKNNASEISYEEYDPWEHYKGSIGPTNEFDGLIETQPNIKNVGWTIGNECPYRCKHCYSMTARRKGRDLSKEMVDRIVDQLAINHIKTVNLGGNEPLFTNGLDPKKTMLPYIIDQLVAHDMAVGLTTSGITLTYLYQHYKKTFESLNDVDVSLDSPIASEHNSNRGAKLFDIAVEAIKICQDAGKPHSFIMAGMKWNFTIDRLEMLVKLAKQYDADVRINPIKPVEPRHNDMALPPEMYYAGFSYLMNVCNPVDLGEPPLAALMDYQGANRCPCGRTSFRIHSITPEGKVYVSPCVYLHDYKSAYDLLEHDLIEIINSPQFRTFRQRHANPQTVEGCKGCAFLEKCGGGCVARAYLNNLHKTGKRSMLARDPYCPLRVVPKDKFPKRPVIDTSECLVHMDYLCTWIGKPK